DELRNLVGEVRNADDSGEFIENADRVLDVADGSAHAVPSPAAGCAAALVSRQLRDMGKILCGLSRQWGLKASCKRCMTSRSLELNIRGRISLFSMPTPCSPVMEPPTEIKYSRISFPAASVRASWSRSRMSNRMSGCRLPSPAWKM